MCGIAGIVGSELDVRLEEIRRMCQTIVHRGPDDEGIYVKGPVGLGVRRLRIIDVTGGNQPIHNEDRSIWTVFNGEIYNFQELRSPLLLQVIGSCFGSEEYQFFPYMLVGYASVLPEIGARRWECQTTTEIANPALEESQGLGGSEASGRLPGVA